MNIELALANLKRHGFDAVYFETAAQAAEYVAGELRGMSVGIGGSKTVEAMGLYETLAEQGEVYWHWKQPTAEERERAAHAQTYLSSANGISETGEIVNIDGMGNRVASTIYGHDRSVRCWHQQDRPQLACGDRQGQERRLPAQRAQVRQADALRPQRAHALP